MDLINREQLKSTIRAMVEIPNEVRVKVLGAISREKAVDAVPVVRCKDCVNCYAAKLRSGKIYFYQCLRNDIEVEVDDFCSYGERKDT